MSNIVLAFEDATVTFTSDAYLNATQIAKHFNKRVQHYLDSDRTKEYIQELTKAANPALNKNQLVIVKKGGKVGESGTWLHPKLTIDFARWLSAKFAIWCDMQIEKILHSNTATDNLYEFLQPITTPIEIEDFNWRYQVIMQALQNLKKTQVNLTVTITGEELLAGKGFEK
jgi:hypothetical protein